MSKIIEERLYDVAECNRVSLSNLFLSSKNGTVHDASHNFVSLASERSNVNPTITDTKCSTTVALNPSERASVHNLILNEKGAHCTLQSITILASILEEVHELVQVANKSFLPSLSIFGSDLKHSSDFASGSMNDSKTTINDDDAGSRNHLFNELSIAQRDKELIKRMGKFLPELQKLSNFCKRIQHLIQHLVWQSVGLFSSTWDSDTNFPDDIEITTKFDSSCAEMLLGQSSSLKFLIAEALSKLCRVLIELDYVIEHNVALKESWDLYTGCIFQKEEEHFEVTSSTATASEMKGEGPIDVISIVYHSSQEVDDMEEVTEDKDTYDDGNDDDSNHHETNPQCDFMKLERMLVHLDNSILSSRNFLMAIDQSFYHSSLAIQCNIKRKKDDTKHVKYSNVSMDLIVKEMVKLLLDRFLSTLSRSSERKSLIQQADLIGVYGLFCLYRRLVPTSVAPDDKLYKNLLSEKLPFFIPIIGEIPFVPYDFLHKFCQLNQRTLSLSNRWGTIKTQHDKVFVKDVHKLHKELLKWLQKVESVLHFREYEHNMKEQGQSYTNEGSDLNHDNSFEEQLTKDTLEKVFTLLEGIHIAKRATYLLRNLLLLSKNLDEPLNSSDFNSIEILCTIAKSVERTCKSSKQKKIIFLQRAGMRVLALELYQKFDRLRSFIDQHLSIVAEEGNDYVRRQYSTERIAISLGVIESILKGSSSFSTTRIATLRVAVSACQDDHPDFSSKFDVISIERTIHDLCILSDFDECVKHACDCSFLFFHQNIYIPLMKNMSNFMRTSVKHVMIALQDPYYTILQTSNYLDVLYPGGLHQIRYRDFLVHDLIEKEFVESLSCNIESILRQRVVSKDIDELPPLNPKHFPMKLLVRFNEMKPLLVCGVFINIKSMVELSLEKNVYNSSTIGHQDTRTHLEMSISARDLSINLLDSLLPVGVVKHVVNVLDVANNMQAFVSQYDYDMNQQHFIQRATHESRYLMTIGIENVSVSLSQHGLGSYDRMLRSILQYIPHETSKFISKLQSELFFSLLSKEVRWFEDFKQKSAQPYPYKRAITFRETILDACSRASESLLESCVQSMKKIGNALGMCRLLNTSYRQIIIQSALYDPGEEHEKFSIPNIFISAKKLLDECTVVQEATETLTVFHILYPILCLQYLESCAQTRDMIRKKVKIANGFYMDDGFILGAAFLSEYFVKTQLIDCLNWTLSIKQHFQEEKNILKSKIDAVYQLESDSTSQSMFAFHYKPKGSNENSDEKTGNQVLIRRLEMQEQEMNMLQFKFYSFRTLFHSSIQQMK